MRALSMQFARWAAFFLVVVLLSALITSRLVDLADRAANSSEGDSKGMIKESKDGSDHRFVDLGQGRLSDLLHSNTAHVRNVAAATRAIVRQTRPQGGGERPAANSTSALAGVPKATGHTRRDNARRVHTSEWEKNHPASAAATEIDHKEAVELIKCHNQTRCIQPELQLKRKYDVYYCKHINYGVRFFYLVREGLLLHPLIRLVDNPHKAEVIVYLPVSAEWEKTECNNPVFKNKTVVLDEGDYQQLFEPAPQSAPWLLYFKRSYARRDNGIFNGYMNYIKREHVLPMTYTIADAYVKTDFNLMRDRDLDVVCTLRGSSHDPTRERVKQWVMQYVKKRGIKKYVAGEVNSASRTVVSKGYFGQLYRAKIIVTSNPSNWEGDFRLMEAFASGALIFVDYMYVPRPQPLLDNKHVVFYNNNNKTDLFEKLDFYRQRDTFQKAKKIAVNGYIHTMRFHRAANLVDYVFRTIHCKSDAKACKMYSATGYEMRGRAIHIHREAERQKHEWEKKRAASSPLIKVPPQSRDPLELPLDHNTHSVHGNQRRP